MCTMFIRMETLKIMIIIKNKIIKIKFLLYIYNKKINEIVKKLKI
jgi:hypothetical protein